MSEWPGCILEDFQFKFASGTSVLDLGCGEGDQLAELIDRGVTAYGIDFSMDELKKCNQRGLHVAQARGEQLPFHSQSFDGVICKVVLPYTDERMAVSEIARVIKPGGSAYIVSHCIGYYLRYLLQPPNGRIGYRIYGARTLLNTWFWTVTGKRLPGFLGDTLYQSRERLMAYYKSNDMQLIREYPSGKFLGFRVFLYDYIGKSRSSVSD